MYLPKNNEGKIEWFAGIQEALLVYRYLIDLSHIWDDLIDKDKDVSDADINYAFAIVLVILPSNPFWRRIEPEIRPMWVSVIMSYAVANAYERKGDEHCLEISHGLRYAAGQVIAYIVTTLHGAHAAAPILEEMWPSIMPERFEEYKKEHSNE